MRLRQRHPEPCACGSPRSPRSTSCRTCWLARARRPDICACGNRKSHHATQCRDCHLAGLPSPEERFWSKVERSAGAGACWLWLGHRVGDGYGGVHWDGRTQPASRIAWRLTFGPIPEGLFVCHHCDNPPCVNPAHLFLGSHADNMQDKKAKGRSNMRRGSRHPHAKLSEAIVPTIRALATSGETIASIARRVGVGESAIREVVKGRTWTHVR